MLFSSVDFFIFFLIFILFVKFFHRFQKHVIIFFSLFFYSYWNIFFLPLILFYCFLVYFFLRKNYTLIFSIFILLIPLIYFKYSFFLFKLLNLNFLVEFSYKEEIPLAISFITFTAIAVLVDRKNKPNHDYNISNISEYILYFPQLIAGPILRLNQLLPQLKQKIIFNKNNIKFGIILFSIGYLKKVYFADNIALIIDPIFQDPNIHNNVDIIKAFLLFPIQIYFDFSGYVDMAVGISIILGISLPQNFDRPYLISSITEFWRRWHMTLSSWFRDYLYIPLGGSQKGKTRMNINLIFTMIIAGLWHGASLNFILWGFLNGLFLTIEKFLNFHKFGYNILSNIFICFIIFNLWMVFRITDFEKMIDFFNIFYNSNISDFINKEVLITLMSVFILILSQKFEQHKILNSFSSKISFSFLMPLFLAILIVGISISLGQSEKFIYFQF